MIKTKKLIRKYFITIGLMIHLSIVGCFIFSFHHIYSSGLSLPLFSEKASESLSIKQPNLYRIVSPVLNVLTYFKAENNYFREIDLKQWTGKGARLQRALLQEEALRDNIYVSTVSQLLSALKHAQPGQTVMLSPGEYYIDTPRVVIGQQGSKAMPIHVTALQLGTVKIFLKGEGVVVNKSHWQFSNLHLIGNCKRHSQCEHAFHVVGKGQHTVIKNNILQDFNAMIKVNGHGSDYPDYGKVIQNSFFNSSPRNTANPVTPFDLMHANNWQVSDNFIFDIQKSAGDKVSYAAFFKGGSEQGVFERNLVICAANLPDEYTALGLSLGGGGSLKAHRRNQNSAEHVGGIIRHNIIMHCGNDVGIYVNRSRDSLIEHNTLYNTLGIDVRYPESDAVIVNNVLSGRIKLRNQAQIIQSNNLIVRRDFFTGTDRLSDYFLAPDIGDFSWKKTFNPSVKNKLTPSSALDFCHSQSSEQYVGAYSASIFCKQSLNLKSNVISGNDTRELN
jgi:hypothetical protein